VSRTDSPVVSVVSEGRPHIQHIAARPPAVLGRTHKAEGGGLRPVSCHRLAQHLGRSGRDVGRLILGAQALLHGPAGDQLIRRPVQNQNLIVVVRGLQYNAATGIAAIEVVAVAAAACPT
jgi:hypothetical protein